MLEGQKFKTVVFGGFDRRHVVQCITNMVSGFNSDVDSLKKDYGSQIEQKNSKILEYETKCENFCVEIKNLRDEMINKDRQHQEELDRKVELINSKDQTIFEMNEKIQDLETKLNDFKNEDEKIENKIKYAEMIAKQRVKKILQQAKLKIQREYRENLDLASKESRCLRKKAREDASKLLKNAVDRAYEFTVNSKKEAKRIVENFRKKSDKIISSTRSAVEDMLKNSAVIGDFDKINVDFDVDFLKSKIDEEFETALERLNGECESCEKATQTS